MTALPDLSNPTDLSALRRYIAGADSGRRLDPLDLERLAISDDGYQGLADAVTDAIGNGDESAPARVVILKDETPIKRAGEDLARLVERQLTGRFNVETVVLRDGHPTLHADEAVLDQAAKAVVGADAVVTVGSGTITDIGKVASDRSGSIPLVAVQTAPRSTASPTMSPSC